VLGFALFSLLFELTGIEDVVWHRVAAGLTPFIALTLLFTAFMIGWPLVMVILFVGRHPERLWTPRPTADEPAPTAP
jgi:hypothetical protein